MKKETNAEIIAKYQKLALIPNTYQLPNWVKFASIQRKIDIDRTKVKRIFCNKLSPSTSDSGVRFELYENPPIEVINAVERLVDYANI